MLTTDYQESLNSRELFLGFDGQKNLEPPEVVKVLNKTSQNQKKKKNKPHG